MSQHPFGQDIVGSPSTGFDLSDIGDVLKKPFEAAADVATSALDRVPGGIGTWAKNLPSGAYEQLVDFSKTVVGQAVLTIISGSLYGPMAATLGPQLASIAWTFPSVLKGDDFTKSWIREVSWRAEKIAEIFGGDIIASVLPQEIKDKALQLFREAAAKFPSLNNEQWMKLAGVANFHEIAKRFGIREDVAKFVESLLRSQIPDVSSFDLRTGKSPETLAAEQVARVRAAIAATRKTTVTELQSTKASMMSSLLGLPQKPVFGVPKQSVALPVALPHVLAPPAPALKFKVPTLAKAMSNDMNFSHPNPEAKESPNYLLYGGIAAAVVAAVLVLRKKR
jgi:hypothetical protein